VHTQQQRIEAQLGRPATLASCSGASPACSAQRNAVTTPCLGAPNGMSVA
jgi:hypothetical protein